MQISRTTKQQMIANTVDDLLVNNNESSAPVNVERLAKKLDLQVTYEELEDQISGFLVLDGPKPCIGVNKDHPVPRQRFTIAHEIAHFLLHAAKDKKLFIDRNVYYRNVASQSGDDHQEIEANYFAAELLMPEVLLRNVLEQYGADLSEDDVEKLASVFEVSEQAMGYRLTKLNLLRSF